MNQLSKLEVDAPLDQIAKRLRQELSCPDEELDKTITKTAPDLILVFAYNRTGKTRLTMDFKDQGKPDTASAGDTLYYNAFTEDLFTWNNDLPGDVDRRLMMNVKSNFFGEQDYLELEGEIRTKLHRYADFDFEFANDQDGSFVFFRKGWNSRIKISRGEENLFVLCLFMSFCERAIREEDYDWVKYIYIDDPISSLDDQNAIAVAEDLGELMREAKKRRKNPVRFVISSHHALFFNVICNVTKKLNSKRYFLHRKEGSEKLTLRSTDETPFFQHLVILAELQSASKKDRLFKHHFNALRGVLEKTACFFGFQSLQECFKTNGSDYVRILDVSSHARYSLFEPEKMSAKEMADFDKILDAFLGSFNFSLPPV